MLIVQQATPLSGDALPMHEVTDDDAGRFIGILAAFLHEID
jgi:hypothetical protein